MTGGSKGCLDGSLGGVIRGVGVEVRGHSKVLLAKLGGEEGGGVAVRAQILIGAGAGNERHHLRNLGLQLCDLHVLLTNCT